jgi:TatD DNase family protein
MAFYVDTHCHLDLFPNIREEVNKEDETTIKTISVTNTPALWKANQKLFGSCQHIRTALGLHPELASQRTHETALFDTLCKEAKYIGEIGLDGVSRDPQERSKQRQVFDSILQAVRKSSPKILTIHSRRAVGETIDALESHLHKTSHQVILHWYSGTKAELQRAVDLGFYFSINHAMVRTKAFEALIEAIPAATLLTETDAPFTFDASTTTRSQSLSLTIDALSKVLGQQPEECRQLIWQNFSHLVRSIN